ncbi:Heat shock 70 kDa protein [Hondaea fermentalgiana]|uniref:Heat shock 70 kDa protein n=1 Tax=Hondaea fermentalgiana TaxID=2315210 RepID=A0A2R5GVM4_9STRA|nr:Heat shock 70 kDa protein [Hondaea fermentalgiana]|eukprot:GBG34887.1 Heat shock 70 kDa protein [Hondaea fermentalgiana]
MSRSLRTDIFPVGEDDDERERDQEGLVIIFQRQKAETRYPEQVKAVQEGCSAIGLQVFEWNDFFAQNIRTELQQQLAGHEPCIKSVKMADEPMEQTETTVPPEAPEASETSEAPVKTQGDPDFVCGIDLGSFAATVAKVSTKSLKSELLRNDMSNERTPMTVAFAERARSFGEVAEQLKATKRDRTVANVMRFLDQSHGGPALAQAPLVGNFDGDRFVVEANGEERKLRAEELLGMVLRRLARYRGVDEPTPTEEQTDPNLPTHPVAVAVPDSFSDAHRQAIRDAAKIGGVDLQRIVDHTDAAIMDYVSRRSAETLDGGVFAIVNVGHTYASCAVFRCEGKQVTKLASKCIADVGGAAVDDLLFDALNEDCKSRKGEGVSRGSKASIRLMTQVRKLKESLSGAPQTRVSCESLVNDEDVSFTYTQAQLEEICAPLGDKISSMLRDLLENLGTEDNDQEVRKSIRAVELIGGGMRMPLVKQAISAAFGEDVPLGYTMDSTASVVVGTALCCAKDFEPKAGGVMRPAFDNLARGIPENNDAAQDTQTRVDAPSVMSESDLDAAVRLEQDLLAADAAEAALHAARNKLESRIFETRALADGGSRKPHTDLIDRSACVTVLDEFENWLWDASESASADDYANKLEDLDKALEGPCAAYWAKIKEEREKAEREMQEQETLAAAELAANGGKDDHDQRKLKKPERMRKVKLNKDEGTQLFKDGNYNAAKNRYLRSLQHADKFFDLGPDDEEEVKQIKLSLHLNMAQCSIKLEEWAETVKSAKEALELDANSTKALFRLAFAQEKTKEFTEAKKNLARAIKIAPEAEQKPLASLLNRVNLQIQREEARRAKMAKKMFG